MKVKGHILTSGEIGHFCVEYQYRFPVLFLFLADINFSELYLSLPMVKKDRIKADTNIKPAWTKWWKVVIWIIVG